ncbi:MAG: hypothetical protein ACTSR8_19320 [Promethearchaeota archaeon]
MAKKGKVTKQSTHIEDDSVENSNKEQEEKQSESNHIHFRIKTKEKELWEKFAVENKFPSVSQLIRFAVNEVMERGIKRTTKDSDDKQLVEEYKLVKELLLRHEEERKEYMTKFTEVLSAFKTEKDFKTIYQLKGKVLKLLEKGKFTSEELAQLFNLPETEIVAIMNELMDKAPVKLNKKLEYELMSD